MSKEYKFIYEDRDICKDDIPEIKEWLKFNEINKPFTDKNHTLLEFAVIGGSVDVVRFLIENGADKYSVTGNWRSLIELAAMYDNYKVIKYFLENEFNREVFMLDNSLVAASVNNFPKTIKYLLIEGKDIEQFFDRGNGKIEPDKGFTALRAAAQENSVESVKLLCELGANVNVLGEDTPLYSAAAEGNLEVVKILLKYGADINQTTNWGATPYSVAKYRGHQNIAEYLLAHGANPDIDPS